MATTLSMPMTAHAYWTFQGLGMFSDSHMSKAYSINDAGQIVGESDVVFPGGGATHAFITGTKDFVLTDLHQLGLNPGSSSYAIAINNSGQVTGGAWDDAHTALPSTFITGPNGVGVTDLGRFGGLESRPYGINESGQIAGLYYEANTYHAFITGPNGVGMTDLNISNLTPYSVSGLNNSGQIAGQQLSNNEYHAFITGPNGTGLTKLEELHGVTNSTASGINNSGQVIGYSTIPSGSWGFVTDSNGVGVTNLGGAMPFGINDSGEVVGRLFNNDGFIYSHGGITNLSMLEPVIESNWTDITPMDINNNGEIVGYGINENGDYEGFYLSYTPDTVFNPQPIHIPAIPEPENYLMFLAGLCLIGFLARNKKVAAN